MRCVRFRMKSFDYKSIALPAELQGQNRFLLRNL
jgi:hypothetical protein